MAKITFNSYKKAIQDYYEIVKNKDITSVLLTPSPAQLRNYCTMLVDKGLSKKDEEIFKAFFETKSDEKLKKSIESCNTDKFKTIISFLKDKRDSEMALRIEMASIIVDFSPRPYADFLTSNSIATSDNKQFVTVINGDNDSETKVKFEVENFNIKNVTSENLRPRNIKKKIISNCLCLTLVCSTACWEFPTKKSNSRALNTRAIWLRILFSKNWLHRGWSLVIPGSMRVQKLNSSFLIPKAILFQSK